MAVNRYDKDEELNVRVDFSYFSLLMKYVAPFAWKMMLVVAIMFGIAFLELLPPYFTSIVLDKCLPESNYALLARLGAALLVAYLISWALQAIRPIIADGAAMDIIKNIRRDLFAHLQKLPLSYFDSRPHGKILVRVVNYVNSITDLLATGFSGMVTNVFKLVVIFGFMIVMDVRFTLIASLGLPIFVVLLFIIKTHHRNAWQRYSAKQSNLNAYIQESISGMKITQSFAREDKNADIFDSLCAESKRYWMRSTAIGAATPRFINILSTVIRTVIYALGVWRIAEGSLTVGTLIAFASYVSRFWEPIVELANFYNQIVNCGAYLERIFQMMEEPLVVEDHEGAGELTNVEGEVSFKNVTFAYEKGLPNILEDVSFDVAKGETIALVGPTGAGKSTVINILARFYDIQKGSVTIDGTDISEVTLNSLHSQMGIMLQDSFLFSGTIADNIRYSKLDATDEEVREAAKAVCAHDFIMEFPDGYDTLVTEGGTSLSAGQKQLIAFARALLADPRILILDEATSSIDTETELTLQKGLDRLLEGRTSFVIAHRLSTIKNSSRIMYISNKGIAECGTHEELLEKKGKYYELYMAQYKFLESL